MLRRTIVPALLLVPFLGGNAQAEVEFAVTKTSDSADGVCDVDCSLREAVAAANAAGGPDSIAVPGGTYALSLGGITVTDDLTLSGAGRDATILDGGTIDRIVRIESPAFVRMSGITVRNGRVPDGVSPADGGAVYNAGTLVLTDAAIRTSQSGGFGRGGGIFSSGLLVVSRVVIDGNRARGGGGLANTGTMFVVDAQVTNSVAIGGTAAGGGIYNTGTATIAHSTISSNTAPYVGGGIRNSKYLTVRNSTISGNTVTGSVGGGIANESGAVASISNTTISGNRAQTYGGGVFNQSVLGLWNTTAAYNVASTQRGGALYNSGGTVQIGGTILAGNTASGTAENCFGTLPGSDGYNLEDVNTCGFGAVGDVHHADPALGPLQDNGGPTWTHALGAGSAAIDAHATNSCIDLPSGGYALRADQRGYARPVDGSGDSVAACDIGAFEAGSAASGAADLRFLQFADSPDPVTVGQTLTYAATFTNEGPIGTTGVEYTQQLAPGTTFVSATPNSGACRHVAGVVHCWLDYLAYGENGAVAIGVTAVAEGTLLSTATVTAREPDPATTDNSAMATTVAQSPPPSADLRIAMSAAPESVTVGDEVAYTITIANDGPDEAADVVVSDALVAGLSYVSATPSQGSCSGTGIVVCNLGTVAAFSSASIAIVVETVAAGAHDNTATVASGIDDPDSADNSVTTGITVVPPDTTPDAFAFADVTGVEPLATITSAPVTIAGITAPAAVSVAGGEYAIDCAGPFTPQDGTVVTGQTLCVRHVASMAYLTATYTTLTVGGISDTFTSTTRAREADLVLTQADDPDPVPIGDRLTYTITVTNSGPDTATDTVVTDVLPATVSFISSTSTQGSCSGTSTMSCALGSLPSGASATVRLVVDPHAEGTLGNTATVASSVPDPLPDNNTATASTQVIHVGIRPYSWDGTPYAALAEGGPSATYTVVLGSQPSAQVTVSISPGAQLSVSPTSVTFSPSNWMTPQAIIVGAVDDTFVEGTHSTTLSHYSTSADRNYDGLGMSFTVTITDNDFGGGDSGGSFGASLLLLFAWLGRCIKRGYPMHAVMLALMVVTGCARTYKPEIYELPAERIPGFDLAASITYVNAQSPGPKYRSKVSQLTGVEYTMAEVTEGFNRQLGQEIARRAKVKGSGSEKVLKSQVRSLRCRKPASTVLFPTFMLACDVDVVIETGDGDSAAVSASQKAPIFGRAGRNGLDRSLDGTLATAVAEALRDRQLLDYLAR